jgi:predicted RNase H-like HicB family nuclease
MSVVYWARFFRQEDGGYSVDVPDMRGCLTEGDNFDEAYHYLTKEAIPCWLGQDPWPPARGPEEILAVERFEEDTEPILVRVVVAGPDEVLADEAGLVRLRRPPGLAADLERAAEAAGRSLGEILAQAAREYLERQGGDWGRRPQTP